MGFGCFRLGIVFFSVPILAVNLDEFEFQQPGINRRGVYFHRFIPVVFRGGLKNNGAKVAHTETDKHVGAAFVVIAE